jgi:hypothetical protein
MSNSDFLGSRAKFWVVLDNVNTVAPVTPAITLRTDLRPSPASVVSFPTVLLSLLGLLMIVELDATISGPSVRSDGVGERLVAAGLSLALTLMGPGARPLDASLDGAAPRLSGAHRHPNPQWGLRERRNMPVGYGPSELVLAGVRQ